MLEYLGMITTLSHSKEYLEETTIHFLGPPYTYLKAIYTHHIAMDQTTHLKCIRPPYLRRLQNESPSYQRTVDLS